MLLSPVSKLLFVKNVWKSFLKRWSYPTFKQILIFFRNISFYDENFYQHVSFDQLFYVDKTQQWIYFHTITRQKQQLRLSKFFRKTPTKKGNNLVCISHACLISEIVKIPIVWVYLQYFDFDFSSIWRWARRR